MLKRVALHTGLNCGQCIRTTKHLSRKEKDKRFNEHWDDNEPFAMEKALAEPTRLSCKAHPVCDQWYLHRFRKTFATKLHHGGTRLKDLQQWLGHKSLSTTEHYLAGSDLKAAHVRQQLDAVFAFGD
jgi:hypothetical protein